MFTCCVPVFRGSRLRKAQSVRLLCCCGHRIKPHGQFGRRYPKNSTQEIFEELHDGFDFSPSLVKGQEQQAASSILCWSENSTQEMFEELCVGFDFSPSLVKGQEQQATSSILCRSEEPTLSVAEARTMRTLKAGACPLSPIWGPRPQENSQDMWQMLRHSRINLTLAYLQDLLPGSVLKHQATPLLIQVDLFQATELETEAPALLPGAEAEKGPHLELDGTPVLFLPSLLALEPAAAPSAAPDPERVPSAAPAQVPGPELDSTGPRGLLGFPPQAPVTAAEISSGSRGFPPLSSDREEEEAARWEA
nr:ral guanine nucleotide dissociation stimulator-like [Equus asinus]